MYFLRKRGVDEQSALANATGEVPQGGDIGPSTLEVEPNVGAIAAYQCGQFGGNVPLEVVELFSETLPLAALGNAWGSFVAERRPGDLRFGTDPSR